MNIFTPVSCMHFECRLLNWSYLREDIAIYKVFAGTLTEFTRRVFSVLAPHNWN